MLLDLRRNERHKRVAECRASCVPHIQPQRTVQGTSKSPVQAPLGISGITSSEKDTAMGGLRHSFSLCLTYVELLYLFVMFFTYLFKSLMTFKWKISCWLKAGRGIAGKMKCTIHNQIQMTCSPGFQGNEANEYSEPLVIRFEQPWQREGCKGRGVEGNANIL